MTNDVLAHWSEHLPRLIAVDLLGPFNVRADAWMDFIENTVKPLQRFGITQSPRFDLACFNTLRKRCGSSLTSLRLKEMAKINDEWVDIIISFKYLTSLDISRPARSLSDEALTELLAEIGANLTHLDISGHEDATDRVFLEGLKPHASKLVSLSAADLPLLTDAGIAKFFGANITVPDSGDGDVEMADGDGEAPDIPAFGVYVPPPEVPVAEEQEERPAFNDDSKVPPLEHIDLSRSPALSSSALAALLHHSGTSVQELNINQWKDVDNETLLTLGSSASHLVRLNIGWCRSADNFVVKALLDGCLNLKQIIVAGCNRLTSDCPRKVHYHQQVFLTVP